MAGRGDWRSGGNGGFGGGGGGWAQGPGRGGQGEWTNGFGWRGPSPPAPVMGQGAGGGGQFRPMGYGFGGQQCGQGEMRMMAPTGYGAQEQYNASGSGYTQAMGHPQSGMYNSAAQGSFGAGYINQNARPTGDFRPVQMNSAVPVSNSNVPQSNYVQKSVGVAPAKSNEFTQAGFVQSTSVAAQKPGANAVKANAGLCYRCELPGHGINECKTVFVGNVNCLGDVNKAAEEDLDKLEEKARIRKAKAKAKLGELERRRSARNKKNEDVHALEKAEDMEKGRNLEVLPEKRSSKSASTGIQ